jgi:hypothetical protein
MSMQQQFKPTHSPSLPLAVIGALSLPRVGRRGPRKDLVSCRVRLSSSTRQVAKFSSARSSSSLRDDN